MPTLPTCCASIPQNDLGRKYWHEWNPETAAPDYTPPTVPAGVPAWAYLQVKDVDYFQRIADFYIDKRQAWDGEFGGGLGDDSDFTNLLPFARPDGHGAGEVEDLALQRTGGHVRKQDVDQRTGNGAV